MPESVMSKRINPQVKEVEIGVRDLRNIKIYPLSMGDQFKMTEMISSALIQFSEGSKETSDVAFVTFVIDLIKQNLVKILNMVTDEPGDKLVDDMTNSQAVEVVEIIFDVNFESVVKNSQSLIEKVKKLFPSMGQSRQSASTTQDTESTTSSEKPTRKVVQRMGK